MKRYSIQETEKPHGYFSPEPYFQIIGMGQGKHEVGVFEIELVGLLETGDPLHVAVE
jgi:hypothetical protein